MEKSIFEDIERREKTSERQSRYSKYCDLIYYPSSVTPGIELAMMVYKPDKPTHIFVTTHGWHMSIPSVQRVAHPIGKPFAERVLAEMDEIMISPGYCVKSCMKSTFCFANFMNGNLSGQDGI